MLKLLSVQRRTGTGQGRMDYYAHSLADVPKSRWHLLGEHLRHTSDLAAAFAAAFGAEDWARLAGLWHDLGKFQHEFQTYLHDGVGHVDHGAVGAAVAASKNPRRGAPLAFAIAGHHGGMPNRVSSEGRQTPLRERLLAGAELLGRVDSVIPPALVQATIPALPAFLRPQPGLSPLNMRRRLAFWTRMLFSSLVDADFLDTEAFFRPANARARTPPFESVPRLAARLHAYLGSLERGAPDTPVNRARGEVLRACRRAAGSPTGVFSLTVPTGGGKTLSAMSFALRHAEAHALRRVIVVIPYTSIIEQNARVYREALGDANVIEHHSNLDPGEESPHHRLASENWDAPVIVTTSVQFFESLFANRPSRCRKLHNVGRSVIILDEVQSLPTGFLDSILEGLRELVDHYGCTAVLATATQPALKQRETLPLGFPNLHEIIEQPAPLAKTLHRVRMHWPPPDGQPLDWPELAGRLADHHQVLAVVHRRQDARTLARLLPGQGRHHLSALMCAKHRLDVLDDVKHRLRAGGPCRLVSTQLVEAGVDIDFPIVYRALGGLDSMVQAAGRCNREGKLQHGEVHFFHAASPPPPGTPAKGLDTTLSMLRASGDALDTASPAIWEEYFRRLYMKLDHDAKDIQRNRQEFSFAVVAARFRLIEDGYSTPLVVPYGDALARVDTVRREPTRQTLRGLQPFLVSVYPRQLEAMEAAGAVETVSGDIRTLTAPFYRLYDDNYGLVVEEPVAPDPAGLIA